MQFRKSKKFWYSDNHEPFQSIDYINSIFRGQCAIFTFWLLIAGSLKDDKGVGFFLPQSLQPHKLLCEDVLWAPVTVLTVLDTFGRDADAGGINGRTINYDNWERNGPEGWITTYEAPIFTLPILSLLFHTTVPNTLTAMQYLGDCIHRLATCPASFLEEVTT